MSYEISQSGRVKAAGYPFSALTDASRAYMAHPSIHTARDMSQDYLGLRNSPPQDMRDRFFPRNPSTVGMFRTGAALPRTMISTNQGAGQFLTHKAIPEDNAPLEYQIGQQTGFCILEAHLANSLSRVQNRQPFDDLIDEVKRSFAAGDQEALRSAQLTYERLIELGKAQGVPITRESSVGREGLFFIRPSIPKDPILVNATTFEKIFNRGLDLAHTLADVAKEERDKLARQFDTQGVLSPKRNYPPLYFQTDFLIKKNGGVEISDVHLPDVGFFLHALDPEGNQTVEAAQKTLDKELSKVTGAIQKAAAKHGSKTVNLITRSGVIHNFEDTLEINEIKVLRESLEQSGVQVNVITIQQAQSLNECDLGILMNVDTGSSEFIELLMQRLTDESVPMYPDPFLLLAKNALTDHQQISVTPVQLNELTEVFKAMEKVSAQGKDFVLLSSINQIFHELGLPDDCTVFHMYVPGEATPIPFYRYDTKGVQIALNYASSHETQPVVIRAIPINPNNAVLYDPDHKPVYSLFRYMFYQNDL